MTGPTAELYDIVTAYTYLGIIVYYIFLDFISPVADEFSIIIIASLAHTGLMNIWDGALAAFLALYTRNIILFYLSRNRHKLIDKLTSRHPEILEKYQKRMSDKLTGTVLILTFIPKMRILVPFAAGLARVSFKRFLAIQAAALALFIGIYYPLGIFFYRSMKALMDRVESINPYYMAGIIFFTAIVLTVVIGRYIVKKVK